jgi:septum formation protein
MVIPADVDETEFEGEKPQNVAKRLSILKAKKILLCQNPEQEAIVIAADSVIAVDNIILPKALNDNDVRYCLKVLSGKTHTGYTGLSMIDVKSQKILTKAL